jgi:hypothetical protein
MMEERRLSKKRPMLPRHQKNEGPDRPGPPQRFGYFTFGMASGKNNSLPST